MGVDNGNWMENQKEVELRLAALTGGLDGSNSRTKDDGTFQLYNATDGLWYTTWLETVDGLPVIKVADTGEA